MQARQRYEQFCREALDLPVFMQPWYLDAVCEDGHWSAALAEKGGRIAGVWPYFVKKKLAWQYVAMPVLARQMGPYLLPEYRASQKETGLIEALLEQLPSFAAFEQDCNYTLTNWLPLYWHGFSQTTRYSFTLDLSDPDRLWQQLAADYRNQKIPKARAQVDVQTGGDLAEFYRIHNLSYERQGLKPPCSFQFLKRLDQALAAHGAREIFFATDRVSGAIHSVAYLVWDNHSAYFLMAGDAPATRQSGAGILVAWEAIQYARETLQVPVFDFAGSMVRSIERVRRQFGAQPKQYFRIRKADSWLWRVGKAVFRP
jgi:hypothetical protein